MKSFRKYLGEAKATWARIDKLNPDEPDNPDIHLVGGGVYTLKRLRKEVVRHLEDYAKQVKVGNVYGIAKEFTDKYPNMKAKVLGLAEVEVELRTPQMKRKITVLKRKQR
jgi:hypothetical protein